MPCPSPSLYFLVLLSLASSFVLASQLQQRGYEQGTWSNAYCITNPNLSPATPAQCPSWMPISCSSLSEPNYCCAPSTYCAYASDKQIGCCPWGQSCTGNINGGGVVAPAPAPAPAPQPQPSTWTTWQQQPTTTWQQQISTVYVTEGVTTTVIYAAAGQATQGQGQQGNGNGQYCSTLYAHGGNLPTTQAGTCGTILIANGVGMMGVGRGVVVLSVLAGMVGIVVLGMRI